MAQALDATAAALDAAAEAAMSSLDAEHDYIGARLPEPHAELFKTITLLAAERRQQEGLERFRTTLQQMRLRDAPALIRWIATASEPLVLWALHLELDRRNVPPCLRWPANEDTTQAEFITWLADMLWFTRRNPMHEPRFRGWRTLFATLPATAKWHAAAARQFGYVNSRYSVAHWSAYGLALSDAQRLDLMTLPTTAMRARRRQLHPEAFAAICELLLSHAMHHPDRSGARSPDQIANRRAGLFRTFVLSGGSPVATARSWTTLTGETLTRQAISKQISSVLDVLDRRARFM